LRWWSGRILRYPGCTPVRGAFVEIWQEIRKVGCVRAGRASIVTGPNRITIVLAAVL